jgi:phage terminase Nu1 subunit (DNA packaging protein)
MAEIVQFPTRQRQAFDFLERELAALLRSKGADEALIDYAITTLTEVYDELQRKSDCQFQVRLPPSLSKREADQLRRDISSGIEKLRREQHDLTLKLAARLVLTELRLFQHERKD